MFEYLGVIFAVNDNDGSLPNHMTYKIRQNASMTTTTLGIRSLFIYPGPRAFDYAYYNFGFLWLQVGHLCFYRSIIL